MHVPTASFKIFVEDERKKSGYFVGRMLFKLNLPRPKLEKDKGYAWFVMFLSFLSHVVHIGFAFGIVGVMTTANRNHFEIPIELSIIISSVFIGLIFALG